MKRFLAILAVVIPASLACTSSSADETYPSHPIVVIGGFAAGGGIDQMSRAIAPRLAEVLGQPVIVEARPGASGIIAASNVARAKPDGYTLMMGHVSSNAMVPAISASLPYNPSKDFTPIALISKVPQLVVVPISSPAKTLAQFIAMVKSKPGEVNYGSAGTGTPPHFAGELFQMVTGTTMTHVPYKGSGASLADLIAGHVDATFDTVPTVIEQVKGGRLRALAVIGDTRLTILPDVPSTTELGLADFQVGAWYMLMGPPNLPKNVVDVLSAAVGKTLQTPSVRAAMAALSADVIGSTPDEARTFLDQEIVRWARLAKEKKIRSN